MKRLIPVLIASLFLFAAGIAGAAGVLVYKNDFKNRSSYVEIKKLQGGKACKKSWKGKKSLGFSVKGKKNCLMRTPVQGDADRPDHTIQVAAKVGKNTDKKIQASAYVGVALRASGKSAYELRIFPEGRAWQLLKSGQKVASGKERAIAKVGEKSKIRLAVDGASVLAKVNGKKLTVFKDQSPEEVTGRKVALSFGSDKGGKKKVAAGLFSSVKVLVPAPR